MDSLSLHRGGWRDARAVLQALFAELAVYLNRAGGWAAQAPTTDLRTPPPTSRSPTRTKQPICRCNNIPRHFLRPTMIEFALLFTCFRKLGPGFRKPSAGPVDREGRDLSNEAADFSKPTCHFYEAKQLISAKTASCQPKLHTPICRCAALCASLQQLVFLCFFEPASFNAFYLF